MSYMPQPGAPPGRVPGRRYSTYYWQALDQAEKMGLGGPGSIGFTPGYGYYVRAPMPDTQPPSRGNRLPRGGGVLPGGVFVETQNRGTGMLGGGYIGPGETQPRLLPEGPDPGWHLSPEQQRALLRLFGRVPRPRFRPV